MPEGKRILYSKLKKVDNVELVNFEKIRNRFNNIQRFFHEIEASRRAGSDQKTDAKELNTDTPCRAQSNRLQSKSQRSTSRAQHNQE